MYANRSMTGAGGRPMSTMSGSGPRGMMNSYFASKGLDMSSPTRTSSSTAAIGGSSRTKKISTGSSLTMSGRTLSTCQPVEGRSISGRVLDAVRIYFCRKVDSAKNELVAVFQLEKGLVTSYYIFKSNDDYFELTERRRQLLFRYYNRGSQLVVLYYNLVKSEHYLPISGTALAKIATATDSTAASSGSSGSSSGPGKIRSLCKSQSMTAAIKCPRPVTATAAHSSSHSNTSSSTQSTNSGSTSQPPVAASTNRSLSARLSKVVCMSTPRSPASHPAPPLPVSTAQFNYHPVLHPTFNCCSVYNSSIADQHLDHHHRPHTITTTTQATQITNTHCHMQNSSPNRVFMCRSSSAS